MSFHIVESNFNQFFEVPYQIYPDYPFISQFKDELKNLFSAKNPMIKDGQLKLKYWVAVDDSSKLLGRIVAHLHQPSQIHFSEKTGFFGYFDCVDQIEVAEKLMGTASQWLKSEGCTEIVGNFNLLATQMMGVLEEGFEHPAYLAMNTSGPAIPKLLDQMGFEKFFPMTTFEVDLNKTALDIEKAQFENTKLISQGWRFTKASRANLKQELEEIRIVMNDAFQKNPFFTALSKEEFWFQAKDLMLILDPEITTLAYAPNGKLAGAIVTIPDVNTALQKGRSRLSFRLLYEMFRLKGRKQRALLLFAAVSREHHSIGLGWTLLSQMLGLLKKSGYQKMGITWVSDENKASLSLAKRISAEPLHRLHLYRKSIS